jgi:hypothetical protein
MGDYNIRAMNVNIGACDGDLALSAGHPFIMPLRQQG